MDAARLAAIRAREQAASLGPWFRDGKLNLVLSSARFIASVRTLVPRGHGAYEVTIQDDANAVFIAAARADVPDLLAEVERLRAGLASLQEPHAADCITHHRGLENSCTCIPDRLTIFHNARIDALLSGGHE